MTKTPLLCKFWFSVIDVFVCKSGKRIDTCPSLSLQRWAAQVSKSFSDPKEQSSEWPCWPGKGPLLYPPPTPASNQKSQQLKWGQGCIWSLENWIPTLSDLIVTTNCCPQIVRNHQVKVFREIAQTYCDHHESSFSAPEIFLLAQFLHSSIHWQTCR